MSTALAAERPGLRLLRPLGEGETSRVWLGELDGSGTRVAIKLARTSSAQSHLADEAERLLYVDSAAVAGLVDAGVTDRELAAGGTIVPSGTPYLAVEWVDGAALDLDRQRAKRSGSLSPWQSRATPGRRCRICTQPGPLTATSSRTI